MDWQPVQGVPRLLPDDRWDRLQPPRDLTNGISGYRKWMDGWMEAKKKFFINFNPSDVWKYNYKCMNIYNNMMNYDRICLHPKC